MKIAVLDIETTGLNPIENRITEIGIVFIENYVVTGSFETLINPETKIPGKISRLTGIDNVTVSSSPLFGEVAEKILELTADHIIVGHHVHFDFSFLKQEMKKAGYRFTRKTLCTSELAKYLLSHLNAFSLSALCKYYKIQNRNPHRALADAEATASLFLSLTNEKGEDFIDQLLIPSRKSLNVPNHLRETVYKQLPQQPGVYYFIDKKGKPVYIGKATNLRNRVLSHFRGEGNSVSILALGQQIRTIQYQETGNDILASLLEDHEIRHYWPILNRAQKKNTVRFGVVMYTDQAGRWRLNIAKSGKLHCFIAYFHQYHLAVEYVIFLIEKYGLNPNLCGQLTENQVSSELHHENFLKMIHDLKVHSLIEIYFEKGRRAGEKAFIWIENSMYKGYGFVEELNEFNLDVLMPNLTLRKSSVTSEALIRKLRDTTEPSLLFRK